MQYINLPEMKIHVILMPQCETISPERLLLEFLFLQKSDPGKIKCALRYMLGSGYVIQKVLQRHTFIISMAEWKVQHLFQKSKPCAGFDLTSQVVFGALKWHRLVNTGLFLGLRRGCSWSRARHRRRAEEEASLHRRRWAQHGSPATSITSPPRADWGEGPPPPPCQQPSPLGGQGELASLSAVTGWRLQRVPASGRGHRSGPAAAVNSRSTI
ncbi:uncharacterized protein LOC115338014 [Aquila chrysaetos chrysaetos]|uniref:uncharacterized protein LOC115338014 n=1 Tax=Aquila chrysaetos chrysaetos TaxID=223781 RepID=UPI001176E05E|nr:uncharacterized protein LOC115338014 [Aquila chrysaetos chrysaetos]